MKSDLWTIAEVRSSNQGSGVFRYLKEKPLIWQEMPLSEEVSLIWKYEGDYPDSETQQKMDMMEEALLDLFFGKESFSTLVMTVDGHREWVFYAHDYAHFMVTLNRCLAGLPGFPIQIEHSHDPEWKYWHSFVDWLEKKEHEQDAP